MNISGRAEKPRSLAVILGLAWRGAMAAGMFQLLAHAKPSDAAEMLNRIRACAD